MGINLKLTYKINHDKIYLVKEKYVRKGGKNMFIVRDSVQIEYDMITSVSKY